jgi:transposase
MNQKHAGGDISVLGIDLSKRSFHLHGVDRSGKEVIRKKMNRRQLLSLMASLKPCRVGLEACGGAHDWARRFQALGHEVRLMSPQFVKPYVKSNKNDALDAEAICEAVQRPNMRFVPIKSTEQQDIQSLHRARSLAMSQRTAQINQVRGLLLEYGLVLPQGAHVVRKALPGLLEDAENALSFAMRELLADLREELVHLDERIAEYDRKINLTAKQNDPCERLMTIPGVGPLIATALIAAVGDVQVFKSGREMAAWLGLVPRQRSTGGRPILGGISKRGDRYLRTLLIHGARSAVRLAGNKTDRRSRWVATLAQRRGHNIAAVALANKNIRTAWALLTRAEVYQVIEAV